MRQLPRRAFLSDLGMGFTGLVLGAMLHRDGIGRAGEVDPAVSGIGQPHFPPRIRHVIWLFMIGGVSHLESFDPKPELNRFAGKTFQETPYESMILDSPYNKKNLRELAKGLRTILPKVYPLQVGFQKRGQSGIEVSDWLPRIGECIDDIAVVRSMWTTDNDHGAQLQFHTGRHILEGPHPTIGSWIHYSLGTLNEDLPSYVVLGGPLSDCCGGLNGQGASYLGPEHDGVRIDINPKAPLPFAQPPQGTYREEQEAELRLIGRLNRLAGVEYPDDPALRARIQSYELAARMQTSVPEVVRFDGESAETQALYGLDRDETRPFGQQCLTARRLVERGVRFVQIFHGANGGAGTWDAHSQLKTNHATTCQQVDQPIAGLLTDLKRRGLLDETLLVWGTEFGRTPGAEGGDGRDHHPYGFAIWLAGGGVKGGVVHGATDELGFHAVENRHYVTDLHATVLHLLGLDSRRLEIPGHKRLESDYGRVIREILA